MSRELPQLSPLELACLRAAGFTPCNGARGYVRDPSTDEPVREPLALELARKRLGRGDVVPGMHLVVTDEGRVVDRRTGAVVLDDAQQLRGFVAGWFAGRAA